MRSIQSFDKNRAKLYEVIEACPEKPWGWCCGQHDAEARPKMDESIYSKVDEQFIAKHPEYPWCKDCIKWCKNLSPEPLAMASAAPAPAAYPVIIPYLDITLIPKEMHEIIKGMPLADAYRLLPKNVWNYRMISPAMPLDVIIANPNDQWDPKWVCFRITLEEFNKLPPHLQDPIAFMKNGHINVSVIEAHPEVKWDYQALAHCTRLSPKFIIDNRNENWDWCQINHWTFCGDPSTPPTPKVRNDVAY